MEIITLPEITDKHNKYDIQNYYTYYRLLKDRIFPFDLSEKWIYNIIPLKKKKDIIMNESYSILRMVDKESFLKLYCRIFNPIYLTIECQLGGKEIYDDNKNYLYHFDATIYSIDDAAVRVKFRDKTYKEIDVIRNKYFNFIEEHKTMNCDNFIRFGIEMGGVDESW